MKHLKIFIFSAFTLISTVVLRTVQLIFLTDAKTGFFKDGMEGMGTMIMAIIIGVIAVSSLLVFVFKKENLNPTPSSSLFLGCAALFAGIANLAEPFVSQIYLNAVPQLLIVLRLILIVLTGLTFCWFGISILFGAKFKPALSIIPVIAYVIRLMSSFICFTGMSNISENLYDVLMLISTLFFLLLFGKAVCGLTESTSHRKLFGCAIAAILFSAASSIPCLIVYFSGNSGFVRIPVDSPVTGLFMAIFISTYLVDICKKRT